MSADEALTRLEALAAHARHELAGRTDAGREVLHYLAQNGAPATRRAVAANPSAAPDTNRCLADDQDDEVRAELARKIARLMPGLSKDESDRIRQITIETLERLAKDQVTRVRAILAEEIKNSVDVPKFIVQTLARDVHTLVAAPILEYSPLLSDTDLLEIIATARAEEVLTAIARRKPLDAKVADAIVSSLEIPAIAALLANPDASIREKTLDELAAQAEKVQSWHEPIALRTDLSKRAIWRIASFVASSLIEQLVARYGLDEELGNHLNKELRARLQDEGKAEKRAGNAAKDVAAAKAAGTLNEAFVDVAAGASQRDTVILALSALSQVPEATVRKIFAARSAKPVTALVWHAGLSMRLAFRIQSCVLKLGTNELLPARAGVHFPMTEDEMRWHLGYFNIAA
ncbi:MAG: DUF2336 domain-containing protein [Alphaproteobacteria bacterium]|nr:DUF2336 domain-containing protein [Alphaproteobacteria bacterium]MBL7098898.1 DUF2336 domain-containing protein [Alphaproteobacteria bacterium]